MFVCLLFICLYAIWGLGLYKNNSCVIIINNPIDYVTGSV